MTKENREILLRVAGTIDGLFFATESDGLKDALECVSNQIDEVLRSEAERNKNEQRKAD